MAALSSLDLSNLTASYLAAAKMIRLVRARSDFVREKLIRPFGFKGGYLTELWQIVSSMQSDSGISKIGIATQSVLYGDAGLFTLHSEANGNALMDVLANKALELVKQTPFINPVELIHTILPDVIAGKKITGKSNLNVNFVCNALVSVDNAAWLLYAAENKLSSFEAMIPAPYKQALSHHNDKIAIMYQIPYGMPMQDLKTAASKSYFIFKIKTRSPGSQSEMLAADIARLTLIHQTLKEVRTNQTADGKFIPWMPTL